MKRLLFVALVPLFIAGCPADELCDFHPELCEDGDGDEGPGDAGDDGTLDTCEEVIDEFLAETDLIRACTSDDQCGQVLTGTSCGCTRNWVARNDADITYWSQLQQQAWDMSCSIPGTISTCDCPPADGFACVDLVCTWNYL